MVEERSRRLPPWMVATTAALAITDHSNNDAHHTGVLQGDHKQTQKPATRRTSKRKNETQDAIAIENPEVTANGSSKKKKGRKPRKESASSGQEFDLTVEDLLSIAQQYVKEDEETRQMQSDSGIPATSDLETSKNATSQDTSTNVPTIGTEDDMQSMLELFLGPLPKKPVGQQSLTNDVDFDCYLDGLSQANAAADGTIPPAQMKMKKKSSLKDRVSSLLH